jgi:hypothetical protein
LCCAPAATKIIPFILLIVKRDIVGYT